MISLSLFFCLHLINCDIDGGACDGSYTYLHPTTGTFTAIAFFFILQIIIWRLISWLNRIHNHMVVIIFLLLKKIMFSLPNSLTHWYFNWDDRVKLDHLCKEKFTLDTIELYDEPIVLFTDILCNIAKSCRPRTTAKQKKHCSIYKCPRKLERLNDY